MKILRTLALLAFGAAGLTGCGDGGVQSPDFTAELLGLTLSSDAEVDTTATADYQTPAGAAASLNVQGTFTLPPGSDTESETRPTSAEFEVTPADDGRIQDGAFIGVTPGAVVSVVATRDGVTSEPITFRITPAELVSIAIDPPDPQTISEFQTQTYAALGTYTDTTGDNPPRPVSVTWTEVNTSPILSFSNPDNPSGPANPAIRTRVTPAAGSAGSTTTVQATAVDDPTLIATVTLNIDDTTLTGIQDVVCTPSTIAVNATANCVANGTYTNAGSGQTTTAPIPNELITWTTPNDDNASVDANGVATGLVGGQTSEIVATISAPADTASAILTITDARCTTPFLAVTPGTTIFPTVSTSSTSGTGAGTPFSTTCLLCDVIDPGNVIDGDIDTFGTLSITLGLLNPTATLATNGTTTFPPNVPVGFVIAQPPGVLLSAELLSTLTVTTLDGSGNPLESAGRAQPTFPVPGLPLNATLLGAIGGQQAVLVSFTPTQNSFNGLALTFDGGLLAALPAINVFQACATADPAATP